MRNHADNELRERSKEMLESALADPDKYDADLKAADDGTKYVMNGMMAWALEDAGDLYLSKAEEALNDGRIEDAEGFIGLFGNILYNYGILNPKHTADLKDRTTRYIGLNNELKARKNSQVVTEVPDVATEVPTVEEPEVPAEESGSTGEESARRKTDRLNRIEQSRKIRLGARPSISSNISGYSIDIEADLSNCEEALYGNGDADKLLMRLGEDAYTGFYDKNGKPRKNVAFDSLYVGEEAASKVRRLATAYKDNLESSDEDLLNALEQAYLDDGAEYNGDATEPVLRRMQSSYGSGSKSPEDDLKSRFRSGGVWTKKGAFKKDFEKLLSGYAGMEDGPAKDSALLELGLNAYVGRYIEDRSGNLRERRQAEDIKGTTGERFNGLADAYKNNRDKPEAELLAALKKVYPTEAERKAAEKERKEQQKLMDDESKAAEENRKRNKMLLQDDEKRVEQPKKGGKNTPVKKYTDWIADARLSEGESMAERIMEALDDLGDRKKARGNLKIVIGNWMNGVDAPKGFDKDVFDSDVEEYRKDPANNAKWEAAFPTKTSAEPPNPSGTASAGSTPEPTSYKDIYDVLKANWPKSSRERVYPKISEDDFKDISGREDLEAAREAVRNGGYDLHMKAASLMLSAIKYPKSFRNLRESSDDRAKMFLDAMVYEGALNFIGICMSDASEKAAHNDNKQYFDIAKRRVENALAIPEKLKEIGADQTAIDEAVMEISTCARAYNLESRKLVPEGSFSADPGGASNTIGQGGSPADDDAGAASEPVVPPVQGVDGNASLLDRFLANDDLNKKMFDRMSETLKGEIRGVVNELSGIDQSELWRVSVSDLMKKIPKEQIPSEQRSPVSIILTGALSEAKSAGSSVGKSADPADGSVYSGLSQSDRMRLAARVIAARRLGADVDPGLLRETTAIAKSAVRSFIAKHPFRG